MTKVARSLCGLVAAVALVMGMTQPLSAGFWGCLYCKQVQAFCLSRCWAACQYAGDNEHGSGIYCENWYDNGLRCAVDGGPCFNVDVEGEEPDCVDYCPG